MQSPNTFTQHSRPWVQNSAAKVAFIYTQSTACLTANCTLVPSPHSSHHHITLYRAKKKNKKKTTLYLKVNYMQCFCFFLKWKTLFSKAKHLHYVIAKYILVTSTTSVNCLVSVKSAMHSCHTENTYKEAIYFTHTTEAKCYLYRF